MYDRLKGTIELTRAHQRHLQREPADALHEVANGLSLDKAGRLLEKAASLCHTWDPTANPYIPSVGELESNPTLKAQYAHDMLLLEDCLNQLAPLMNDPSVSGKLGGLFEQYKGSLNAVFTEHALNEVQANSHSVISEAALARLESTYSNTSSLEMIQMQNAGAGNTASVTGNFDFSHLNSSSVLSTDNIFAGMPDHFTGDNIMIYITEVFMKLGIAMQSTLALQGADMSALADRVSYLNKVQAAYTEITDYYANGNPPATTGAPDPANDKGIHSPLIASDLDKFFPNLKEVLMQNGWTPTGDPKEQVPAAAFSQMNLQADYAGQQIDDKTNPFPQDALHPSYYGTSPYFSPTGASEPDGKLYLTTAGPANSAIKALSNLTSTGSSISQKKTTMLQSTQTNYNNVWGFTSSFIKELQQSLQAIAQA